jgi:hypothetical protein
MNPSPKDMPRRLPVRSVFKELYEEANPEPKPAWANDLRWQRGSIWGQIKVFENGTYGVKMEVRFAGTLYTSSQKVEERDADLIPDVLTEMVYALDELMEEHGHPPYEIRSIE